MSTVHEVITARHCDMKILGFSLITNICVADYDDHSEADHEEVTTTAKLMEGLLKEFVSRVVFHIKETMNEDVAK